jgi:hypothetical protein
MAYTHLQVLEKFDFSLFYICKTWISHWLCIHSPDLHVNRYLKYTTTFSLWIFSLIRRCVGALIAQSVALGYGLDHRSSRVRFPAGAGNFSLHHRVQNGSGAQSASCPMDTRALSLGVKRSGHEADHSPPSSVEVKECVELYLHSPIRLNGVALIKKFGSVRLAIHTSSLNNSRKWHFSMCILEIAQVFMTL